MMVSFAMQKCYSFWKNLKTNFMKMIEVLKEEMNNPLKKAKKKQRFEGNE